MIINVYWSSCTVPIIPVSVMKLEFSRQVFEKYSNIKFHENLSSGSRIIPCRQTDRRPVRHMDRHNEANSHFLQFCHCT